jgi:hypothetical protein
LRGNQRSQRRAAAESRIERPSLMNKGMRRSAKIVEKTKV